MLYCKTFAQEVYLHPGQDILQGSFYLLFVCMYHRQSNEVDGSIKRESKSFCLSSSFANDSLRGLWQVVLFL